VVWSAAQTLWCDGLLRVLGRALTFRFPRTVVEQRSGRAEPPVSASAPRAVAAAPSFQACLRVCMFICSGVAGRRGAWANEMLTEDTSRQRVLLRAPRCQVWIHYAHQCNRCEVASPQVEVMQARHGLVCLK